MTRPTRGTATHFISPYSTTNVTSSQNSCGAKVVKSSCGMGRVSDRVEDEECDQERVERHRLGQREPEHADAEHLVARGRVAGNRAHERAEDVADTHAGPRYADRGKPGTDHLGRSWIDLFFPLVRRRWRRGVSAGARRRADRDR